MPCKTTKLLEENLRIHLYDLGMGKDDLERTQKALNIKEKKQLLNKVTILHFCLTVDAVKKMNRQTTNICSTYI